MKKRFYFIVIKTIFLLIIVVNINFFVDSYGVFGKI